MTRPSVLPVQLEAIAPQLKAIDRWVMWRMVRKTRADGAVVWAKVPFQTDGKPADTSNRATWCSYGEAVDALLFGEFDGIGFVLADDDDITGVDLDDCLDPATGELSATAKEILHSIDGYAEVSPSGTGIKLFTRAPLDRAHKDNSKGIEVYTTGRYFTVTGHQINGHGALPPVAQDLNWLIEKHFGGSAGPIVVGGDAFANYREALDGWPLERVVAEVLPHLEPEGYDDWITTGMALHHQGGGDSEWLSAWDEWSAQSGKYVEGECERKWASFSEQRLSGGGAVTLASLLARTKEARVAAVQAQVVDSAAAHRAAVEAAADEAAVRAAAQRIALDAALDPLARDILVGAIQTRLRALTGIKPTVAAVRAMVAMRRERGAARQAGGPEWVEPWVYVTGQAKFFNRQTKESITREAFDAAYNRFMEPDDDGNVLPASRAACEVWQCPVVYGVAYLPSAGDLFTLDGQEYVNLYRPDTVPSSVWDAACSAILDRHITLLVPDETYRKTLLQWLAWVVRNPGRKVLWAVLIKGVEGDGKSILGNMLGQAMGFANVGIISPDTLSNSSFNDWAVGRCVNVVEELKLQGHNRHDVVNKIKPLITNERIELHGKGKAATTAINTTNYLAFSNHADAIPLDQHDRRQFVLFTPWASIADMHAAVAALGLSMDAYWDQLWGVVKNRPDAVRGYFDAVDLAGFDPHSRAPATVFKDAVVAAGDLDDAEAIAKFHIEEGAHGVSASILSSACLTKLLAERDPPVVLHTTRVRKLLEGLGFKPVSGLIKWKGMPHRVWIRVTGPEGNGSLVGASPAELRAALDLTAVLEGEEFLK